MTNDEAGNKERLNRRYLPTAAAILPANEFGIRASPLHYSWLNAQLAEAVKFSSHQDRSTLQDQHFT
jgi:hypothetical protein